MLEQVLIKMTAMVIMTWSWGMCPAGLCAQEDAPFPLAGFTAKGIQLTQSYGPEQPMEAEPPTVQLIQHGGDEPVMHVAMGHPPTDPWAHSHLMIHLGIAVRPGWSVLSCELISAKAVLDNGDMLSAGIPAASGWMTASLQVLNDAFYAGAPTISHQGASAGLETLDLTFANPDTPAAKISHLPLEVTLTLAETSAVRTLTVTPRPGVMTPVPGLEKEGLQVMLADHGQLTWSIAPGALSRICAVRYLTANGVRLHTFGQAVKNELDTKRILMTTTVVTQAPAAIELDVYTHVRSADAKVTLTDLPLIGKPKDPLALHPAQHCQEHPPVAGLARP